MERRTPRIVLVALVVGLVLATLAVRASLVGSEADVLAVGASSSSSSSTQGHERASHPVLPPMAFGVADGVIPDGSRVSVFDEHLPAIANLDPDLLAALRGATTDAGDAGVGLEVNSGWRSAAHQEQLLREAIGEYGSEEEAARWVATPDTSAHVTGDAVDVGPPEAAEWLAEHGAVYGLCRIYDNEPWHYELRPEAVGTGCPARYTDPTEDPRMQP